jgi:hypothetical protein
MVHNSYPTQYADTTYDMDQCVARLLSFDMDQSRRLVEFPNLLTGNPRHIYALLNEHPLARKLNGAAVPSSAEGIQRLMIMGLVVKHVQLATKSKHVDSVHPASFLSYIGYAGGVLSPCSPGEKPFQASALFPVLHIARWSEQRALPSDSGSEDSATKKMTKMSHITYRSSTIEVIGKTAHFERVQKTVALRNMSVDGHLAKAIHWNLKQSWMV